MARFTVNYQVVGASSGSKVVEADSSYEAEREVRRWLENRPEMSGKPIIIKEVKKI
ncbi:MAG: hypothetical protein IJU76_05715 [Desulfovibrionaceae bacterium]|nr:hypothetical protein [Desulfovibrionaceae bacterium]